MASLRNAIKRVTHKERDQPQHRKHLGHLEKKSDYKVRAVQYHKKTNMQKAAYKRASMKNPDEFYFGMHNAQLINGQHGKTAERRQRELEEQLGSDTIRLLKDQDMSYITMQEQKDRKKIEKLQAHLHFADTCSTPQQRTHTVFVESAQDAQDFDVATHFGTAPQLAGRAFNRPKLEQLLDNNDNNNSSNPPLNGKIRRRHARKIAKARAAAYRQLQARHQRVQALERAAAQLQRQRLAQTKGRKRLVPAADADKPAVYKFRRQRLR